MRVWEKTTQPGLFTLLRTSNIVLIILVLSAREATRMSTLQKEIALNIAVGRNQWTKCHFFVTAWQFFHNNHLANYRVVNSRTFQSHFMPAIQDLLRQIGPLTRGANFVAIFWTRMSFSTKSLTRLSTFFGVDVISVVEMTQLDARVTTPWKNVATNFVTKMMVLRSFISRRDRLANCRMKRTNEFEISS